LRRFTGKPSIIPVKSIAPAPRGVKPALAAVLIMAQGPLTYLFDAKKIRGRRSEASPKVDFLEDSMVAFAYCVPGPKPVENRR
jgi:hypothetical protein